MNKQLIQRIQEIFFAGLDGKTGWGKNDIKDCYNQSVVLALLELTNKQEKMLEAFTNDESRIHTKS